MQFLKSIVASVLVSLMVVMNLTPVMAAETTTDIMIEDIENEVTGLNDLTVQLNDLYHQVGEALSINYLYVKILHLISGGKAIYADSLPNINVDTTVDSLPGAFDIVGASQRYELAAPWIYCSDDTIDRPSRYYVPDAAYSVTAEVVAIMNNRYYYDRGNMQVYFDALSMDVKTNIVFCEAILEYIGSDQEDIDNFYSIYEKLIYDKEPDENVLVSDGKGTYTFKDKFKQILIDNGLDNEREIEVLSIVLSFDSKLAASSSTNEITDTYVIPYTVGYTSRENMMIAAMSVVGKVRYVWGGGHGGTGSIDGINPIWDIFYKSYPTTEEELGFSRCIKPTISWCPIHGEVSNKNSCLFESENIYSVDEYLGERAEYLDISSISDDKYKNLLESSSLDFEKGITSHRLDGLDCSGYTSWLFNQITDGITYDSGAMRFISQKGIQSLGVGVKCLPGDVFSWGDHIVVIVGPAKTNSNAYVMVEAGPNTVKFGVVYYNKATAGDISKALGIAIEANKLLGGLPDTESTRVFSMDNCTYSDEEDEAWFGYHDIGRLTNKFIDENTILSDYGKKIVDMTAQEIIQHTINNLTYQYVSGIDGYDGNYFDTEKVYENSKIDKAEIVDKAKGNSLLAGTQSASLENIADKDRKVEATTSIALVSGLGTSVNNGATDE